MTEVLLHDVLIGRAGDGTRVRLTVELGEHTSARHTVDHELIESYWSLSIGALTLRKHSRRVTGGGQCIEDARSVATEGQPESGISREQVARLVDIWEEWHLNDTRAGCAHQQAAEGSADEKLNNTPPCPLTGYRWGSAWLVRPLPDAVLAELREICAAINENS